MATPASYPGTGPALTGPAPGGPAPGGPAPRLAGVVVLVAGVAAAAVLRHLGTKPLWLDEAVSVSVAGRSLPHLFAVLAHRDANAGLYYVVLHGWLRFGRGAAWDRGLSAACFVATAGSVAWIVGRWRGAWLGLAAGLLIATNRFLVFYGQEARPYSAAVLLAVVSTALLWSEDGVPAVPYVVVTVLLLYTDLFAALFVAAQALALVVARRRAGLPPSLVRCWAAVAALTAPLWLVMLTVEHGQIAWIPPARSKALVAAFEAMGGGPTGLALLGGLGLVAAFDRRRISPRLRTVLAVLTASFAGPPVLLWSAGLVVPAFVDRYLICSTLGVIGAATIGLGCLGRRRPAAAGVALAVVVGLGGRAVIRLQQEPVKYENAPAVAALVTSQARPGDAVGFGSGGLRLVVDAYRRAVDPFPADVALASPGGQDVYAREVDAATVAARLDGAPVPGPAASGTGGRRVERLWLITDPSDHGYPSSGPFGPLRGQVARLFRSAGSTAFPGMDVTLLVRRP